MNAKSRHSEGISELLLGSRFNNNIHRHNSPGENYKLDDATIIPKLFQKAESEARYKIADLRQMGFFDTKAEAFIPVPPNVREHGPQSAEAFIAVAHNDH